MSLCIQRFVFFMRKVKGEAFQNAVIIATLLRMTTNYSEDNENVFSGV